MSSAIASLAPHEATLGLRANAAQFTLLVIVNACVGAMVGLERAILPALAESEFHLVARSAILSFIVVFGLTKAVTNYVAGRLSDRRGSCTVDVVVTIGQNRQRRLSADQSRTANAPASTSSWRRTPDSRG